MAEIDEDELVRRVEKAAAKGARRRRPGFWLGLVIGVVATLLVMMLGPGYKMIYTLRDSAGVTKPVVGHDLTLRNSGIFGYTSADFKEAVLGAAEKKAELIVYQREVEDTYELTDTGLFNWNVFTKTQNITFYGTAIYVVNMQEIGVNDIVVDDVAKTITITIPHAFLKTIDVDPNRTVVEDPERGLLAFGETKLTAEQQREIETQAQNKMNEKLAQSDAGTEADESAISATQNLFEIAVDALDESYTVNVQFDSTASDVSQ